MVLMPCVPWTKDLVYQKPNLTVDMPQRTTKLLIVRSTAKKNALLFEIRVTCFARYTVLFSAIVIKMDCLVKSS